MTVTRILFSPKTILLVLHEKVLYSMGRQNLDQPGYFCSLIQFMSQGESKMGKAKTDWSELMGRVIIVFKYSHVVQGPILLNDSFM